MVSRKIENFLDDQECKSIIDSCKNKPRVQNRYEISEFILPISVYKKLEHTLFPNTIECRVQRYDIGDSFSPHRDNIWVTLDGKDNYKRDREQSISILLNDEFKGGDLVVEHKTAHMNKGDATLFGADDLHWVNGVSEGTRYSLAAWGVKTSKFEKM